MSKKKSQHVENEWSYLIAAEEIHGPAKRVKIAPDAAARSRLIKRLNVLSIDDLEAEMTLRREQGNVVHVDGVLRADITQRCIVTMDPVKNTLKESFEAWFADREQALSFVKAQQDKKVKKGHVEVPMLEERDDPEPIEGGKIDLGELVTQHLSLAIDPYPKALRAESQEGEEDETIAVAGPAPERMDNPFAALKDWKDKITKD